MDFSGTVCVCKDCVFRELVFSHVPVEQLGNICISKTEKSYKKGVHIVKEGDEIHHFLYLKEGLIKLHKKVDDTRDQIIMIAKPYDFVSMLTVFSEKHYNYSVTALEDSTVCFIQIDAIKELILKNSAFALSIIEKMSKTADEIINTTFDLRKKHLRGRIAHILLYFAEHIYKHNSFELPISRKEMAELINMTTENVIRIMSEFRKDHLIRINGKEIEILNYELLKKVDEVG